MPSYSNVVQRATCRGESKYMTTKQQASRFLDVLRYVRSSLFFRGMLISRASRASEEDIVIIVRDHGSSMTSNIYKYAYKLKAAVGSQSLCRLMVCHTLRIGRAISARVRSVHCVTGWRVAEAKAWNAFSCVIVLWHHRCHRRHDRTFFFEFLCLFCSVFLFFF